MTTRALLRARQAASGGLPWALLAAASLGMFTAASSGTTRAPFLIDMARDLATNVPHIANLVALTSVSWGVAGIFAGAGCDRWGRRPFLIGGPLALAVACVGVATAPSFLLVALWATLAGACSGTFTGVIFTEVSARVAGDQQGRALGWVMSGQSLTLLLGVPLAAWVGAYVGWRGVNLCIGALAVASAASLLAAAQRRGEDHMAGRARMPSMRGALSPQVLRLLTMGVAERVCYGLIAVYYATFLQMTFGLALEAVALPLAVFALGNIVGTVLGGQLADRWPNRKRTFALAMFSSGIAALALFGWHGDLTQAVALGFAYVFCNAIARPSLMASLTEVPEHVRGTVMGLNVTANSMGWIGAAGLGGWMLGGWGFAGFGPLTAAVALAGGALAFGRR